ncbi:MAG TPA: hypothetical protein VFS64_02335 [Solirubrobacterales bacterium]|nr:hypothetical protein [Solirubrobacterales bacterium]
MERSKSLGGVTGNEILTCAVAAVLTVLLLVEGVTILQLGPLLIPHMFVGLVLIPPVLLKLGTTGYRFARYYMSSPAYREKGPPLLPLRLMAPVLVAATFGVFVTGVALLVEGHKSNTLLFFHKATFVVWGAVFGIHFLAYAPRVLRSLAADWSAARRRAVGGSGLRGALVGIALGIGFVLAMALLPTIDAWQGAAGGGG